MKLNLNNHDFSIVWDGVFYKSLAAYPNISEWELRSIIDFVEYEKQHDRNVELDIEDNRLRAKVLEALKNPKKFSNAELPEVIRECTACMQGGCVTKYLCHTASVDNAIKILETGRLLSAANARGMSIDQLVNESRNAANDPSDYFDYVMFSWGNCQTGDRLVMERNLKRMPTEKDLSEDFSPGIRFYFATDVLRRHPEVKSDGYHPLKVRNEVILKDYVYAIIIPEAYREMVEYLVPCSLKSVAHYIPLHEEDIWLWSNKVHHYILNLKE